MRVFILLAILAVAGIARGGVTLDEAIHEAVANNAGLLAEKANIGIANAQIVTARVRPNPAVSLTGDHLDLLGTGFNNRNGGGPSEVGLGVEFTQERGAKRQRRIEVATTARSVVELEYLNSERSLLLDVENAFIDSLLARDSVRLAQENLGFFQQIVEVNDARVRAGDLAEVELIRSRVAALQYQTAVRQAELRYQTALLRLQTLMGRRRPDPHFEVEGDLDRRDTPPLLDTLRQTALASRPDLNAARRDIKRAEAETQLQLATAKPDVTWGTEYRRQQVNASANALSLTVGMQLPVFNRNEGEIARAREEQRQAELRTRALETTVLGDVEAAYAQYTAARSLLDTIQGTMLKEAREVRDITEYSYKRGDATFLALLDAQRALNDTMQSYIEARGEFARSLHLLDFVSGKGVTR